MLNLKTFGEFFWIFSPVVQNLSEMLIIIFLFVPGFLLLVKLTVALYDSSDDVVQLTSANFDRLVTSSDNVWIIEFFAPWCKQKHLNVNFPLTIISLM